MACSLLSMTGAIVRERKLTLASQMRVCDVWSVCVLQLQIQQQGQVPQPDMEDTGNESEDEIDAALTDLQVSLEGSAVSATGDITRTPELHGYIRFFKYALMTSLSKC